MLASRRLGSFADNRRCARTANKSAEVAEATFTNLERPYIFITCSRDIDLQIPEGDPVASITYAVANYGKTPAIIEALSEITFTGKTPQAPLLADLWHKLLASPIVAANERREDIRSWISSNIDVEPQFTSADGAEANIPILKDGDDFFFHIMIRYRGPLQRDTKRAPAGDGTIRP